MTGEDAFRHVHGVGFWDWYAERPQDTAIFDAVMTEMSRGVMDLIIAVYDFSQFGIIVDVGGGQGASLAEILAKSPESKGILYDLPHVVAGASGIFNSYGVADRCAVVGGNMHHSLPQGGDAYLFKNVLLDEPDEAVQYLLTLCRSAINASGRLIVAEPLATEANRPEPAFLDMTMLVTTGGRKRTPGEYSPLFAAARFRLERSIPTQSPVTLLIGEPV
jgi:hypothetical protein